MFTLGAIGFSQPLLLWGLIALPALWLLLRAVPPAPIRRMFPGVVLLLGLKDDDSTSDRTPWWLLLLRLLAVAAAIIGFAGPVLNPKEDQTGDGPLLILMDGGWASARDWPARQDRLAELLGEAGRAERPVALVNLADPNPLPPEFRAANLWSERVGGMQPAAWEPSAETMADWQAELAGLGDFDSYWFSDGLARAGRAELLSTLEDHGTVTAFEGGKPIIALRPAMFDGATLTLTALVSGPVEEVTIAAIGPDLRGVERVLSAAKTPVADGQAVLEMTLPPELRNRVNRFAVEGENTAGAVALTDDALRRREVALIAGREDREGLELLSPLHYLEKALSPSADLLDGDLVNILPANPDVIVLADVATLPEGDHQALAEWVGAGGLLLRFAGPRIAASDLSRGTEDVLMPVRLRRGGRSVGGTLSWGEPKTLMPFDEDSPFYGLSVPDEVNVTSQVVAEPGPELADRVIAALADGTPLVTRKTLGDGQVVLFHVTANADWSNLPLSGLFVDMLERLSVSSRTRPLEAAELEGTTWVAERVLDGFGALADAEQMAGVPGEAMLNGTAAPGLPPGVYRGRDRSVALNTIGLDRDLTGTAWPAGVVVEGFAISESLDLKGWLLAGALMLLMVDVLASLWLTGRLTGSRAGEIAALVLVAALLTPAGAEAQTDIRPDDEFAVLATSEVVLAHVVTGNPDVDRVAAAGMRGLSAVLTRRTTVEPAPPIAVDLETDELSFFPFLYWPITPDQPIPSDVAYAKLNRYLRNGGLILFDTRDAGIAATNGPNGRKLQDIARPLDIPPLEPIPADHVLTRTFYLLQDFPGRYMGRDVWVEAAPLDAVQIEGMPFRNLNDNVTPVVIGGNDWAAAWAMDEQGRRMFQVGRGFSGERQREVANRFGVNLVMHVLTGNYKSDQVHVPALLDRLGQ